MPPPPRHKQLSAKKRKQRRAQQPKQPQPQNSFSVSQLIQQGDQAVVASEVEQAASLYSAACALLQTKLETQQDSNSANTNDNGQEFRLLWASVLGKLGETKVSLGQIDEARADFERGLSLLPVLKDTPTTTAPSPQTAKWHETRASLSLYLGQLSQETEALTAYRNGVQELERCLQLRQLLKVETPSTNAKDDSMLIDEEQDDAQETTALHDTHRQLSGAYCSIAELYLTDLCFEQDAEQECEAAIQAALKITLEDGKPSVDALQAMANLRLSQRKTAAAAQYILETYDKMKTGCEALAALVGLTQPTQEAEGSAAPSQAVELVEVEAANSLPGFEFRCQTVKLLLECAAVGDDDVQINQRCAVAATQVVGSLLAENDEVIEIWYLAGCAFDALVPPNKEFALQFWTRAMEMLQQVKESLDMQDEDDDDAQAQLMEVEQQMEEISMKLQESEETTEGDTVMQD